MPRAKYNPGEIDGNTKILDGISRAIHEGGTASVKKQHIETVYEIHNEEGESVPGDLKAKCEAICKSLGVQYEEREQTILFSKAKIEVGSTVDLDGTPAIVLALHSNGRAKLVRVTGLHIFKPGTEIHSLRCVVASNTMQTVNGKLHSILELSPS